MVSGGRLTWWADKAMTMGVHLEQSHRPKPGVNLFVARRWPISTSGCLAWSRVCSPGLRAAVHPRARGLPPVYPANVGSGSWAPANQIGVALSLSGSADLAEFHALPGAGLPSSTSSIRTATGQEPTPPTPPGTNPPARRRLRATETVGVDRTSHRTSRPGGVDHQPQEPAPQPAS